MKATVAPGGIIEIELVTNFSSFRSPELSQPIWSTPSLGSKEIRYAMPSTAILYEIQKLYDVSDRLDSLAEQHPLVSGALIAISGSVRNTATLLEVLVAAKMARLPGLQLADA